MLGCCLVSFHFLWASLSTSTVLQMLEFQDLPNVPYVMPICLPWVEGDPGCNMDQIKPNKEVTLAGWGKTTNNEAFNAQQVSDIIILRWQRDIFYLTRRPVCEQNTNKRLFATSLGFHGVRA